VTIINSIISDHGLIQASDSNLTQPGSSQATPGQKVFHLGFSDGALALAGNYSVGIQLMDTWMPSCISAYASTPSPTQEGFANYLIGRLDTDLTSSQKTYPTMFQIVGYVSDGGGVHPALHFVRNSSINRSTGAYEMLPTFKVTEDFWTRDYLNDKKAGAVGPGWYRSYSTEHQTVASPSTISGSGSCASWVTCGLSSRPGNSGHHNHSLNLHRLSSFRYARSERSMA
jgi:hypothetical protein